MTPKKIVVEIGALHNTSYYLAQLAFRNIDEENLEQKCLDNTNPDCETLCLWTLQLVPHYLPGWQQAGFEQLLSTEAVG